MIYPYLPTIFSNYYCFHSGAPKISVGVIEHSRGSDSWAIRRGEGAQTP